MMLVRRRPVGVVLGIACLWLVTGIAGAADHGDDELRGNSGIERLPPKPAPPLWPVWIGLGVVGVVGVGLIAWRQGRRRSSAPGLPAHLWALRELNAVVNVDVTQAGAVERFHTRVSDIVRRYLETRFQLPAPRQTTEEFLHQMQQSPILETPQQELLKDFLDRCDLAKFAGASYSIAECQETVAMARRFVEETVPKTAG